jgi:hypothetical protein
MDILPHRSSNRTSQSSPHHTNMAPKIPKDPQLRLKAMQWQCNGNPPRTFDRLLVPTQTADEVVQRLAQFLWDLLMQEPMRIGSTYMAVSWRIHEAAAAWHIARPQRQLCRRMVPTPVIKE